MLSPVPTTALKPLTAVLKPNVLSENHEVGSTAIPFYEWPFSSSGWLRNPYRDRFFADFHHIAATSHTGAAVQLRFSGDVRGAKPGKSLPWGGHPADVLRK